MKQIFWTMLVLSILCGTKTYGQLLKHYGLKVALTSATQYFEPTYGSSFDLERRIGVNIAGYLEWLDVPSFSIVTQVEYAQRGMGTSFVSTDEFGNQLGVITLYSRLDYLSFPILFKLSYPMETMSPYLLAGPRVDFLLGYHSDQGFFNPVYDNFKKSTIGGSAGVGVQMVRILPVNIQAEFRYNIDFADSYKTDLLKVRNGTYDFWIGVVF